MRPPARVCSSQPGVRVWSSSASRSMVASSRGRGAGRTAAVVPARWSSHRATSRSASAVPRPRTSARRRWSSSSNAASTASGSSRSSGTGTGGPSGASSASATVANPTVSSSPYSAPPPNRLGDSCRNRSRAAACSAFSRRDGWRASTQSHTSATIASGSRSRWATIVSPISRSSSPRSRTGTFRAARQIAATCDQDSHRSPSPANVAGMSASMSTAPSTSRASAWVQRSWCCSHTCSDIPPVTSARSSAALAATSSPTSRPICRSRLSAIATISSSQPDVRETAPTTYGAAASAARTGHGISVRGATNMATPYEPGVTAETPESATCGRIRAIRENAVR